MRLKKRIQEGMGACIMAETTNQNNNTDAEQDALTERQEKILNAIIENYLDSGEPVGSRTISKLDGVTLSSATIRNEMSDLEDMGYIIRPHTSAGRIPTDKGYRFYVDHLLTIKDQEVSDLKDFVVKNTEKMDKVLEQMAKFLANTTQYTSVISAPPATANRLKFVQLSQVSEHEVLAVVVMDGNMVKNKLIKVEDPLDNETILKLNMLLNTNLNGLTVQDINLDLIARMQDQAGIHEDIIRAVLRSIAETIRDDDDLQIYTSGATNVFKYPELSNDSKKASKYISTFEEKDTLAELISDVQEDSEENPNSTGIQVYIGNESPVKNMPDCSVVTANYDLGDGVKGTIGIVGPKRMDYAKVVTSLRDLKGQLTDIMKDAKKEG